MSFLFIQILLLMLLAALFGAWLAYWWMSNRFEEVTDSENSLYDDIKLLNERPEPVTREDLEVKIAGLTSAVDNIRMPDLEPMHSRLSSLEQWVSNLRIPEPDLEPVNERMGQIESLLMSPNAEMDTVQGSLERLETLVHNVRDKVDGLHNTDVGHLESRLADLDRALREIEMPEVDLGPVHSGLATTQLMIESLETPKLNLDPVHTQISHLERRLTELTERLESMRKVDMETLTTRFSGLSSRFQEISAPDMEPLLTRLAAVERDIGALNIPADMDMQPLLERFEALETKLSGPNHILELLRTRMASLETGLTDLSGAITGMSDPDLRPLEARLMRIEELSQQISRAQRSDIETLTARLPDLEPVRGHLYALERDISGLRSSETDIKPILTMLEGLERAIGDANRSPADLGPVERRLNELAMMLQAQERRLDELRGDVRPVSGLQDILIRLDAVQDDLRRMDVQNPDFSGIEKRLSSLQESVMDIVLPDMDLAPITSAIRSIDSRLDLEATEARLTSIEHGLAAIHHQLRSASRDRSETTTRETETRRTETVREPREPRSTRETTREPRREDYRERRDYSERSERTERSERREPVRRQERSRPPRRSRESDPINRYRREGDKANLLVEAAFGSGDDLEEIVGVGPMLGALLNDIGVFYFWQIAEWTSEEIEWVDDQLMHFRGRIERDDWVGQAREMSQRPESARRPD